MKNIYKLIFLRIFIIDYTSYPWKLRQLSLEMARPSLKKEIRWPFTTSAPSKTAPNSIPHVTGMSPLPLPWEPNRWSKDGTKVWHEWV